jgi:hypothetical protein
MAWPVSIFLLLSIVPVRHIHYWLIRVRRYADNPFGQICILLRGDALMHP